MSVKAIKIFIDSKFIEDKLPEEYKGKYEVVLIDSQRENQGVDLCYVLVPKEENSNELISGLDFLHSKKRIHINNELRKEDFK